MFDEEYAVRLSNGKYFQRNYSSDWETDDLRYAAKYSMKWQPVKDIYLQSCTEERNLTYELVKIKLKYEIVEE